MSDSCLVCPAGHLGPFLQNCDTGSQLCCCKGLGLSQVQDFVISDLHVVSAGEFYQSVKNAVEDNPGPNKLSHTDVL